MIRGHQFLATRNLLQRHRALCIADDAEVLAALPAVQDRLGAAGDAQRGIEAEGDIGVEDIVVDLLGRVMTLRPFCFSYSAFFCVPPPLPSPVLPPESPLSLLPSVIETVVLALPLRPSLIV